MNIEIAGSTNQTEARLAYQGETGNVTRSRENFRVKVISRKESETPRSSLTMANMSSSQNRSPKGIWPQISTEASGTWDVEGYTKIEPQHVGLQVSEEYPPSHDEVLAESRVRHQIHFG